MQLDQIKPGNIPEKLKAEFYFDFKAHPYIHQELLTSEKALTVVHVIQQIKAYAKGWLKKELAQKDKYTEITPPATSAVHGNVRVLAQDDVVFLPSVLVGPESGDAGVVMLEKGAKVLGGTLYLDEGNVAVGAGTVLQVNSCVAGPTVLGPKNDVRQGTFLRGSIVTGKGCIFRGEVKNAVFMDETNFPHPSYVGDSLLGYRGHFGNQATTANLGIFEGMRPDNKQNLTLGLNGTTYDIGTPKMGIVLGDLSQVGCNSVSDPGTLLGPRTIVYSLTRISKGFYGPDAILKNKPMEKGIVEISKLT
jgi:hypothetical protein